MESNSSNRPESSTLPNDGKLVRVLLDAMGGDHSPENEVIGAIEAIKAHPSLKIVLCGDETSIQRSLQKAGATQNPNLEILHASEVIGMHDEPIVGLKQKKNSSIVLGLYAVKEGNADAFVSAGNTGAVMSGSTLILGRIPGVSRPTIGTQLPRAGGGFTLLFDAGATVDSKAIHLREYAVIGSIYARDILGVAHPKVGLLSVGEEKTKGNELVFSATELLEHSSVDFIGNVEGNDILTAKADVIVCDGFVGNIVLKFAESIQVTLRERIRLYSLRGLVSKLKAGVVASVLRVALKDFDYQEYGGVPLLGVNGVSIIGHGRSTPKAIKNMVLRAEEMVQQNIREKIRRALADEPVTNP
jgi:glycerol-3-phosphate acyltransferase PlsX